MAFNGGAVLMDLIKNVKIVDSCFNDNAGLNQGGVIYASNILDSFLI